jgi:cytidylate kinase
MKESKPIVAIDGPVGSGKSTTARLAARELGFLYIDTGAMYRAVTVAVLDRGIEPEDKETVAGILPGIEVTLSLDGGYQRTILDGRDVSERIRDLDVTRAVSAVSAQKAVRDRMTELQRKLGAAGGVVMEGRDIGTVVFPDAGVKIYVDASLEVRARRRLRDFEAKGIAMTLEDLMREVAERDRANSERAIAPLRQAPDAIYLDTSAMSIEEQAAAIVTIVRGKDVS